MNFNVIKSKPEHASAIIIHHKKKVLLNLRSNKKYFYPNHWGILGGLWKKMKTLRDNHKEFEEETSMKILKNLILLILLILVSQIDKIRWF